MCRFVVCPTFVENSTTDYQFYCDVLMEFAQDNAVGMVVDAPRGVLLDDYGAIAMMEKDNLLTVWLSLLTARRSLKIDDHTHHLSKSSERLFQFADTAGDDVALIVWQKSGWAAQHAKYPNVNLLDRREAKAAIHQCLNNAAGANMNKSGTTNFNFSFSDNASAKIGNVGGQGGQGSVAAGSQITNEFQTLREMIPTDQRSVVDDLEKEVALTEPNPKTVASLWDKVLKIAPAATGLTSLAVLVGKILTGV